MSLGAELKKRRVVPWLLAYLAGGFAVLEGVDQLVGHGLLPDVAYSIALVFYAFGIPGTIILAWFHGEKGAQRPPPAELWLQAIGITAALSISAILIRNYRMDQLAQIDAAEVSGLDPQGVAVMYFEDLSPDGELGYLADGLTEALIEQLAAVRALDVVSRNGVAPFRGTQLSRDSVARTLSVGTLVEGSIEPRGEEIQVTTRFIDGVSGVDFERMAFSMPSDDPFAVQDEVAERASRVLRRRLGEEVELRERRTGTSNPDAWALVQRAERLRKNAEQMLAEGDGEAAFATFTQADSTLALAVTADPEWTEPLVLSAELDYRRARLSVGEPSEAVAWLDAGMEQVDQALGMETRNADALAARGKLRYLRWLLDVTPDPDESERLFASAREDLEAAVQADPTLADAHNVLSHLYYQTDDLTSVVIAARRAFEEDAYLSSADAILNRLFTASYDLEQHAQAKRWCDEGKRRFPDNYRFVDCQLLLMTMAESQPDPDRAWQLSEELVAAAPPPRRDYYEHYAPLLVGGVLARDGRADSAAAVLDRARADREVDPEGALLYQEAFMRVLAGDPDQAVDLLTDYVALNPGDEHDPTSAGSVYWWWRDIEDDPRFQRVMGVTR